MEPLKKDKDSDLISCKAKAGKDKKNSVHVTLSKYSYEIYRLTK